MYIPMIYIHIYIYIYIYIPGADHFEKYELNICESFASIDENKILKGRHS